MGFTTWVDVVRHRALAGGVEGESQGASGLICSCFSLCDTYDEHCDPCGCDIFTRVVVRTPANGAPTDAEAPASLGLNAA